MSVLAAIHPAAPPPAPGGSLADWLWLAVVLAAVVMAGLLIASRH
jgi:hypothetical protein